MIPVDALALFTVAALALLLTPGPAALGLNVGAVVHVLASVLGLSALLVASASAFAVVKWLGVAYLIYLGIRTYLSPASPLEVEDSAEPGSRHLWDGFWVNLLNPKAALFFLAFFPQFVSPASPSPQAQLLILGAYFVLLAFLCDAAWVLLVSTIRPRLLASARARRWSKVVVGTTYCGLGAAAALASRR